MILNNFFHSSQGFGKIFRKCSAIAKALTNPNCCHPWGAI
jgi:hypothetical protein